MSNQLTRLELTRKATTVRDVTRKDIDAFRAFWTEGQKDVLYVPIADYLAWKGITVRHKTDAPDAVPARKWTEAYRALAAEKQLDEDVVIKKTIMGVLLFDAEFLEANHTRVAQKMYDLVFYNKAI